MKRTLSASVLVAGAALVFACSPDPGPFFTPPEWPEQQAKFDSGEIGLLTPALRLPDELVAYRLLSGLKMKKPAQPQAPENALPVGVRAWEQARAQAGAPPNGGYINPYRSELNSNAWFPNCLDNAFETAARTLTNRRKAYANEATFQAWVHAQDQVFSNCSSAKPDYPDDLPGSAPALVKADRDYQIAAAHFYALDFAGAVQRFRQIAANPTSPWSKLAPYLAARTFLRQASLEGNSGALAEARQQFDALAKRDQGTPLGASAQGLVEHLDAMQNAGATLRQLSRTFLDPNATPAAVEDAVGQLAFVLRAPSFANALKSPDLPDVLAWVQTLERGNSEAEALGRWHASHSLPWLTQALLFANGKDGSANELIQNADRLPPDSPAFITAQYNAVRLRLERDETEAVRTRLDTLLPEIANQPPSVLNAFRAERMRLATTFDDFLRWAPRTPTDVGDSLPESDPILAYDAARVLNYLTPLAKLRDAAHSPRLPGWSAENVAEAAWTRALMVGNLETVRDLAPMLVKAHPTWAADVAPAPGESLDGWRFRAALLVATHSQFDPLVKVNYRAELNQGSWWCAVSPPKESQPFQGEPAWQDETVWIAWKLPVIFIPSEGVLSTGDRELAAKEVAALHQAGSASYFVGRIILDWARSHPDDPLVPEALHRVVVVTRYGCEYADPSAAATSEAAFDLLHKRYAGSPWTAKTPYWFK